jgi:hypothetical protein
LYWVPETLSPEVLEQMKVPEKDKSISFVLVVELEEADGVLFGWDFVWVSDEVRSNGYSDEGFF